MSRLVSLFATALLALPSAAASARAQEVARGGRRGPFELREEWLLAQSRLTLPATAPDPLRPGETLLTASLDWGNDFGWRQDMLGERPGDRAFLVDGEHRTADLRLRRGLRAGLDAGVRVPLHWRGAGMLDAVIDSFHGFTRWLGVPDNGRPFFRRNQFRALGRDAAGQPVKWEAQPGTGLGDVEVDARWSPGRSLAGGRWALVGRVGLPTGTGPFATKKLDFAAQATAGWSIGPSLDLYGGAGVTGSGDAELAGIAYARARGHGFLALEWRPWRPWSLLLELSGSSRLVRNLAEYPGVQSYLRMGAKLDVSRRLRLEAGFSENLIGQQATTDFGVFMGLSVAVASRPSVIKREATCACPRHAVPEPHTPGRAFPDVLSRKH